MARCSWRGGRRSAAGPRSHRRTHLEPGQLGAPLGLHKGATHDARFGVRRSPVISHGLWQRLGAPPDVTGRTLSVDPGAFRIVGVMPRGFSYPAGADFWTTPTASMKGIWFSRQLRFVEAIGRLRAGASRNAATASSHDTIAPSFTNGSVQYSGFV